MVFYTRAGGEDPFDISVDIDPLKIADKIEKAVNADADRSSFVKNLMESTFQAAGRKYNVMVFNLALEYDDNFNDVVFYGSGVNDGLTFGIWAFKDGEFTNEGDGGWINWAFRGWYDFDKDSGKVTFREPGTDSAQDEPDDGNDDNGDDDNGDDGNGEDDNGGDDGGDDNGDDGNGDDDNGDDGNGEDDNGGDDGGDDNDDDDNGDDGNGEDDNGGDDGNGDDDNGDDGNGEDDNGGDDDGGDEPDEGGDGNGEDDQPADDQVNVRLERFLD